MPKRQSFQCILLEMVLVDADGDRIQASIRKAMIRKFRNSIVEGVVYRMIYFSILENNVSEYRASFHPFKLLFSQGQQLCLLKVSSYQDLESKLRPLRSFGKLMENFIGLLTAVGEEKEFTKFGRPIRVLEIELKDESQVSLNTVGNSTRLLWNAQIPEVTSFKNSIMHNGLEMHAPLKMIGYNNYSPTEEFLVHFPRKCIEDLHMTEEEGNFICLGKVEGIVKDDYWWYMACKCHKSVNLNDLGVIVLDVWDLLKMLLLDMCLDCWGCQGSYLDYPLDLDMVIGKELLFKVEVKADRAYKFDDSFKVRRTCDEDIISEFKNEGSIMTPEKSGDGPKASQSVPVIELFNEAEMSPLTVEECSSAAACLTPLKRKPGRGAVPRKGLHGKVLKIEKD
ncbi:hypothetical protein SESBI_45585 [Sesbania bispinosa]|nr:hypothetical protein SESBI_45585 [Sesbania bispinosa]